MKNTVKFIVGFFVIITVAVVMTPTLASASTLTFNDYFDNETRSFTGPDPPFTMDYTDPVGSLVGGLLSLSGINLIGDIYGPGISTWNNGSRFYDAGLTVESTASAVGTLSTGVDFWNWGGKTQKAENTVSWGVSYDLNGTPETSSNIILDYEFNYTNFNLALAGRSKSGASATILGFLIPAPMVVSFTADPFLIFQNPFLYPLMQEYFFETTFDYSKEYNIIGGFKENTGQQDGQLDLGTMGVGDRLYLYGVLEAFTECENYFAGLTVATMFPSFSSTISANEIPVSPVPEPATILLLGGGLAGLAFYRRKRK